jgi:hypothetical protein
MAVETTIEITENVTEVTVSQEVITIDITPSVVELTATLAFPGLTSTEITVTPYNTITETTLQGALQQLADQSFRSSTTPTGDYIEEGDTWYDTSTEQFYVYRETSPALFEWVPIMVGNDSPDSDTVDAGAF